MRVCLLVLLITVALVSAASADLLYYSEASGMLDISATVNFFSKSGFPSVINGPVHPDNYTRGILHVALFTDGNMRSMTEMSTELDLAGRIVPATVSYSGQVYSSVALEVSITPDVTTWRSDDVMNPETYFSTGEADVDSFAISGVPEPSGLAALFAGIAGTAGLLIRRRAR